MNPEIYLIIMPSLGGALFALGGTQISSTIPGMKWIRRYILPFLWAVIIGLGRFGIWQAAGVGLLACGFFHLGYGTNSPWWKKLLVFASYGLISLPLGVSWWNLITPILTSTVFFLSNWKPTSVTFVHKIWEFMAGALIGVEIGYLMAI